MTWLDEFNQLSKKDRAYLEMFRRIAEYYRKGLIKSDVVILFFKHGIGDDSIVKLAHHDQTIRDFFCSSFFDSHWISEGNKIRGSDTFYNARSPFDYYCGWCLFSFSTEYSDIESLPICILSANHGCFSAAKNASLFMLDNQILDPDLLLEMLRKNAELHGLLGCCMLGIASWSLGRIFNRVPFYLEAYQASRDAKRLLDCLSNTEDEDYTQELIDNFTDIDTAHDRFMKEVQCKLTPDEFNLFCKNIGSIPSVADIFLQREINPTQFTLN